MLYILKCIECIVKFKMRGMFCNVFCLLVYCIRFVINANNNIPYTYDFKTAESAGYFNGSKFSKLSFSGPQQCVIKCAHIPKCLSFNYNAQQLTCDLNSDQVEKPSTNRLLPIPNYVHLEKSQWKMNVTGPCKGTTCNINERCVGLASGLAKCIPIECKTPPEVGNATINDVTRTFGTVLTYQCYNGKTFTGDPNILCMSSGEWLTNNTNPKCSSDTNEVNLELCTSSADCSWKLNSVCDFGLCTCPVNHFYNPKTRRCAIDCLSIRESGNLTDGVYAIKSDGINQVQVRCDMTGGGWTYFLSRYVGDENFILPWTNFLSFFGNSSTDYWIGLDNLHHLTSIPSDIYFEMIEQILPVPFFAHYYNFTVGNASTEYTMSISNQFEITPGYESIHGGGFLYHNNRPFSTYDHDSSGCAHNRKAWWWNDCYVLGKFMADFTDMRMTPQPGTYVSFSSVRIKVKRSTFD